MSKRAPAGSKPGLMRVRLSSPFVVKSRCKECMGHPVFYYSTKVNVYTKDPRVTVKVSKSQQFSWTDINKGIEWLFPDPQDLPGVSMLSYPAFFAKYNAKLHLRKSAFPLNVVEFVTCDCMATQWAFTDKMTTFRPEIENRKARYTYPADIEDF